VIADCGSGGSGGRGLLCCAIGRPQRSIVLDRGVGGLFFGDCTLFEGSGVGVGVGGGLVLSSYPNLY